MQENNMILAWSKTLLSVYKYLETVCDAIDNLVIKQSTAMGYNGGRFYSAFDSANKVIELTERKKKLINAKVIVDDGIANLKDLDIKILVLTYFDMMKSNKIAELLNISIRTYFRRKNLAVISFGKALADMGFDCDALAKAFAGEGWLMSELNKNIADNSFCTQETSEIVYEYSLIKEILKDISKVTKKHYAYAF